MPSGLCRLLAMVLNRSRGRPYLKAVVDVNKWRWTGSSVPACTWTFSSSDYFDCFGDNYEASASVLLTDRDLARPSTQIKDSGEYRGP
jgi:hypothetical protein